MTDHLPARHRTPLSRRRVLALALTTSAAAACAATTTTDPLAGASPPVEAPGQLDSTQLNADLAGIEARASLRVGLAVLDPAGVAIYGHRADEHFPMCSTFKTYAAAAILRSGVDLNERVRIEPADLVENSPDSAAAVGTEVDYRQLCLSAVAHSDNTAGNLLLRRLGGPGAITNFARSIDDPVTRLDRWEPELNEATPGDQRDTTTPQALAGGYHRLLLGSILPDADRALLQTWMASTTTSRIRAALPAGWIAADKTGAGDFGTVNDAGTWFGPRGAITVAILTTTSTGDSAAANDNEAVTAAATAVIGALR